MAQITLNSTGVASNGSLVLQSNGTTTAVTVDTAQNVGVGVTPSAWSTSAQKALQVYLSGVSSNGGGNTASRFTHGCYLDGSTWKYQDTGVAPTRYEVTGANAGSTHSWSVAAGGTAGNAITFTQAMTLDASGNLVVGTTTSLSAASGRTDFTLNGASSGGIISFGTGGVRKGYLYQDGTDFSIANEVAGAMRFINNGSERARIDSSGNLKVGTTSASNAHILQTGGSGVYSTQFISSTASSPYGSNIYFSGAAPNGTSNQFLYCNDSSALRMEVRSNGGIANYSANDANLSDRREKTNFAPAKSYLDVICAIPVQTFNYIDQNMEDDGGLTLGVVAQDVQAVAPELVMESNWAGKDEEPKMRLSIYQTDLQYALMKCIQEQQALIQSLTARITALESN